MRNRVGNALWGIAFMVAGLGLAGKVLFNWDFSIFFDGWWTLFIIIPCLIGIIQNGPNAGNIIGLVVGSMLLLSAQDLLDSSIIGKMIFPIILVFIGLSIILRGTFSGGAHPPASAYSSSNANYSAVFSGQELFVRGERFTGANLTAIFGGIDLNLREAIITQDVVITGTVVFGGLDILVPDNVRVQVSGTPIFGDISNKAYRNVPEGAYTIYINATCAFGGVEIK